MRRHNLKVDVRRDGFDAIQIWVCDTFMTGVIQYPSGVVEDDEGYMHSDLHQCCVTHALLYKQRYGAPS